MTILNFPCEDCICVPVCRHKPYDALLTDCGLLEKCVKLLKTCRYDEVLYVSFSVIKPEAEEFRHLLYKTLRPTVWGLNTDGKISRRLF